MSEVVKNELEKYGVVDNPFDNMLYYSLELVRTLTFACKRYKNRKENGMQISPENIDKLTTGIAKELDALKHMSDETVDFCKDTSSIRDDKKAKQFETFNATALKNEECLEISKVYDMPCRNDAFEKTRLGEDSEEYKRLLYLRKLVLTVPEFKNASEDFLYDLYDLLDLEEESGDKTVCRKRLLIDKYSLTESDIGYIISLKKRGKSLLAESA